MKHRLYKKIIEDKNFKDAYHKMINLGKNSIEYKGIKIEPLNWDKLKNNS